MPDDVTSSKSVLDLRTCPVCRSSYRPYRLNQRACSRVCYRRLPDVVEKVAAHHAQPHIREQKNAARRVATDPERRRELNLTRNLKRYGVTPEQYRAMLAEQDGKCALCGHVPAPGAVKAASRLHVDHDHVTGAVRRLLCNGCNRGLGYLQDSPSLLRAAADYIERHRALPEP